MSLAKLKQGDEVIVLEGSKHVIAKVEIVGRKYITVEQAQFDRVTGQQCGTYVGHKKEAYTPQQWDRKQRERGLVDAIIRLGKTKHERVDSLSDEDLDSIIKDMSRITVLLTGVK